MPAKSNSSSEFAKPTPDPAWVGFFSEVRRLASLAQERERQAEAQVAATDKKDKEQLEPNSKKCQAISLHKA